jgi:hypothetical protein
MCKSSEIGDWRQGEFELASTSTLLSVELSLERLGDDEELLWLLLS